VDHCRHTKRALAFSSLLDTWFRKKSLGNGRASTKKKKEKKRKRKKVGSAPIGPTSMLTFPLFAKKKKDDAQKKDSKNNYVAKNANHSSGCWYPHPCTLRCLLLGETLACDYHT
jgi:hypothetical protein